MRLLRLFVLYTALSLGANMSSAQETNFSALLTAKQGEFKKLIVHDTPKPLPDIAIFDVTGKEIRFSDFAGKSLLINLWAEWCAPCRKEMPYLSQLQADKGSDAFEVITLATIRFSQPRIDQFFEEIGVDNLAKYNDPKGKFAFTIGIAALPVSLLIDMNGNEVARFIGDAEWSSDTAYSLIDTFLQAQE
jgi:thiol-disulfide isomerase/thioredoxin